LAPYFFLRPVHHVLVGSVILQGEAKLTLADDTLEAKPGTWVHMPAGLKHGILARTPVVMLLMLLKGP
jgi:quercetin dioxygenase-like cupin family protein